MATQIDRMRTADNHDEWSEANEKSIENWVFSNHRVRNQEVRTEKSWNSKAWCNFGQFSEKICEIIFSHSFIFLATFYQLESNFEVSSRWNWFHWFHLPFYAKANAIKRFSVLTQVFRSQLPSLLQHQDVNTENCFSHFLCEDLFDRFICWTNFLMVWVVHWWFIPSYLSHFGDRGKYKQKQMASISFHRKIRLCTISTREK